VLQEEEVDRLGGKAPIKFNAHVIATTNRDLSKAVDDGEFRQDLFYRLNVIPLRLPSLQERPGDLLSLAEYFSKRYADRYKKPAKELSGAAKQRLLAYSWPGNVRELENMFERAVLLSSGARLEPWDLWDEEPPAGVSSGPEEPAANEAPPEGKADNQEPAAPYLDAGGEMISLHEAERQMIIQALQKTDNNRTHAARILGISVRTLRNKLHEYRSNGLLA
jgi:two-component system response regulator FlrC